ncbi:YjbF family lipoprotein [Loktanella agnita]|uniref:YjbF family lipoprotein n=1 Tax=Loktanella agnita TaxID=287097 RepID=UPI003988B25B
MIFLKLRWFLAGALALSGCGNTANDELIKGLWQRFTSPDKTTATADIDALRAAVTPQALAQIDGPVLLAQVPALQGAAILVLGGRNAGVETFLTPDGVSISTENGMLVATRGFGYDLMTADVAEPLSAITDARPRAVRIHRYLNGENQLVPQSFVCRYVALTPTQINESCQSSSDSFENSYTTNSKGQIVMSRQWISPQLGYITTERLK